MQSATPHDNNVPIAIVGIGCLFPKANDRKAFWRVLRKGENCITEVPSTHWSVNDLYDGDKNSPDRTYAKVGGFLEPYEFDPTEFNIPPTNLEAIDTSQLLSLVCAKAALEDAGYGQGEKAVPKDTTSVILGVTGTLELVIPLGARLGHPHWRKALSDAGVDKETSDKIVEQISSSYVPWQENSFPGLLGNVVAGRIANKLDLHGTNCVVDAACASSLAAMHMAISELQAGQADMVLTGGVDTFNDIFMFMCFSKTPALSETGNIRPFDQASDGTLLGEGVGILVLKRLEDAERDQDRIYAVIKGIGTSSDGNSGAIYAPDSTGQSKALARAYQTSGISPDTISCVEAHGTGTKIGDVVEFQSLRNIFDPISREKNWCALGTVKSQIGHTKASAGSASMCKMAMSLYNKVILPTINVTTPNPKLNIEQSPFYLNTQAKPWLKPAKHPRRAALSSFGFGGSNFHVILEEYSKDRTSPAWDGSVEIFAFSGKTPEEILEKVSHVAKNPESNLAYLAQESRNTFKGDDAVKLTCVLRDGAVISGLNEVKDSLTKAISSGETVTQSHMPLHAFWGTSSDSTGKIAFLFPGQGSQYVGMGREFFSIFPEGLNNLEISDLSLPEMQRPNRFIFPNSAFTKEEASAQLALLTQTQVAQPSLGVVESTGADILARFGVKADALAGHSYGELTALKTAGCYSQEDLMAISGVRGALMAKGDGGRGAMLAVSAPLDQVEEIVKQVVEEMGQGLVLANRNHPTQGVISGPKEMVAKAQKLCEAKKITARLLQVSAAFHSPLLADVKEPFLKALKSFKFKDCKIPVYANISGAPYPKNSTEAKETLANQLVNSVRFVDTVKDLYKDGFRTFIEVGPKDVLCGLVRHTVEKGSCRIMSLDSHKGGDELFCLAETLASLAAIGGKVDLSLWEDKVKEPKKKRMSVPISGANYRSPKEKKSTPWEDPKSPVSNYKGRSYAAKIQNTAPSEKKEAVGKTVLPASLSAEKVKVKVKVEAPGSNLPQSRDTFQNSNKINVSDKAKVTMNNQANQGNPGWNGGNANERNNSQAMMATAYNTIQQGLTAMQALQQQTAAAHQQYLEAQAQMQRSFQTLVANQQMLMQAGYGNVMPMMQPMAPMPGFVPPMPGFMPPMPGFVQPGPMPMAPMHGYMPVAPFGQPQAPFANQMPMAQAQVQAPAPFTNQMPMAQAQVQAPAHYASQMPMAQPKRTSDDQATEESPRPNLSSIPGSVMTSLPSKKAEKPKSGDLTGSIMEIVAEKTGYPTQSLTLDMDLENELGIDSIKRVEILAAIEDRLPDTNSISPDEIGGMHTLRQIVEQLIGKPAQSEKVQNNFQTKIDVKPTSSAASKELSLEDITQTVMEIVAEKTGYPTETLSLDMDLETELGIDSIKRVEILAAIEDRLPDCESISADEIGVLHSLGQIVEKLGKGAAKSQPTCSKCTALTGSFTKEEIVQAVMEIVAEKTGYPTETLSLDMDLETELGIDSIKRVEILAAIEDKLPGTNPITADEIGTLHTLRQVVEKLGAFEDCAKAGSSTESKGSFSYQEVVDTVMEIVAEKTGYPTETLSLDMDLETELGIDSIKRVEILAAIEDKLPGTNPITADEIGTLHTLRQVVDKLTAPKNTPDGSGPGQGSKEQNSNFQTRETLISGGQEVSLLERRALNYQLSSEVLQGSQGSLPGNKGQYVVTDDGYLAGPVKKALEKQGIKAVILPLSQVAQAAFSLNEKEWSLIILQPRSEAEFAGISYSSQECRPFVSSKDEAIFNLKQAFRCARNAAKTSGRKPDLFAVVTRLDGQFGISGEDFNPVDAGSFGLVKVAALEWPETVCRSIDIDPKWEADKAALELIKELSRPTTADCALSPNMRLTPVLTAAPLHKDSAIQHPIEPNSLCIITGGARGVTADCAKEIAKTLHPNLVLLGRSPEPEAEASETLSAKDETQVKSAIFSHAKANGQIISPKELSQKAKKIMANREIQKTLSDIRALGCSVEYWSLDVRDIDAVNKAVSKAEKLYGPVKGFIHAAGVLFDRKFEDKTDEQFDAVFDTKVEGLANFAQALKDQPLDYMIFFSSVTARFGRPGQSDYACANEVMNKFARLEAMRRPNARVAALGWGPWDGGMVNDGLRKAFAEIGAELIPRDSGSASLVEDILHGNSKEPEIIMGSGFSLPQETPDISKVCSIQLDLSNCPVLGHHIIGGHPVVPIALMVEMAACAALERCPQYHLLGTDNLKVLHPIHTNVNDVLEAKVGPLQTLGSHLHAKVELCIKNRVHATCTVVMCQSTDLKSNLNVPDIKENPYPHTVSETYKKFLFHGPKLQGIQSIKGCSLEGVILKSGIAPKPQEWFNSPLSSNWKTDPLLLDTALQMGLIWSGVHKNAPSLPMAAKEYRQYTAKFPKGTKTVFAVKKSSDKHLCGDLYILGKNGILASWTGVEWTIDPNLKASFDNNHL